MEINIFVILVKKLQIFVEEKRESKFMRKGGEIDTNIQIRR